MWTFGDILFFFFSDDAVIVPLKIKNIACDGKFLYLYTTYGLYKIGTGYNGTVPRNIYAHNKVFFNNENGWIGYVKVSHEVLNPVMKFFQ